MEVEKENKTGRRRARVNSILSKVVAARARRRTGTGRGATKAAEKEVTTGGALLNFERETRR